MPPTCFVSQITKVTLANQPFKTLFNLQVNKNIFISPESIGTTTQQCTPSYNTETFTHNVKNLIEEAKGIISEKSLCFVLKLNSHSHLTNKQIEAILADFSDNLTIVFELIKKVIVPEVKSEKPEEITNFLDFCIDPFCHVNTEYKFNKTLSDYKLLKSPTQFTVENKITEVMKKGVPYLAEQNVTGSIMPIEFQIQKYFELLNFLNKTLAKIIELEDTNSMSNFVQGELWQNKTKKNVFWKANYTLFPVLC